VREGEGEERRGERREEKRGCKEQTRGRWASFVLRLQTLLEATAGLEVPINQKFLVTVRPSYYIMEWSGAGRIGVLQQISWAGSLSSPWRHDPAP